MSALRRLLIVEDDARLRDVLSLLLGGTYLTKLVGSAREALDALSLGDFTLALVDLRLPDMDGVQLISLLAAQRPGMPMLVLSAVSRDAEIVAALRAGASGYLFKEDLGARLLPAIEDALEGGVPLSRGAARVLRDELRRSEATEEREPSPLTEREHEVLSLLARGLSYEDIAQTISISLNTVRGHVRALYEKLGVSTKSEAVMVAIQRGWLSV
jgi:DNA-binding NarL/FixJ family response regulator